AMMLPTLAPRSALAMEPSKLVVVTWPGTGSVGRPVTVFGVPSQRDWTVTAPPMVPPAVVVSVALPTLKISTLLLTAPLLVIVPVPPIGLAPKLPISRRPQTVPVLTIVPILPAFRTIDAGRPLRSAGVPRMLKPLLGKSAAGIAAPSFLPIWPALLKPTAAE